MNDIIEILKDIICEYVEIEPEEITAESNMRFDLGASSFDLMNIGSAVEERFNIKVTGNALTKIKTVGDIVEFLKNK